MRAATALRRCFERVPWRLVGFGVALTPVVAIGQGAFLLYGTSYNVQYCSSKKCVCVHADIWRGEFVQAGIDETQENYSTLGLVGQFSAKSAEQHP